MTSHIHMKIQAILGLWDQKIQKQKTKEYLQ